MSRTDTSLDAAIRRNTLILAATLAVYSCVLQLVAAVSSLTFVAVTGVEGLLGLGPAIFLTASGLAALPAGRAMDAFGRRPVIAAGYGCAAAGCGLTALATSVISPWLLVAGFALTGAANAVSLLTRTAAGDMYRPERRARGIAYVLFGSVFGAVLGPLAFGPLFAGREVEPSALTVPWLAAGGLSLLALALVTRLRPDPQRIAEQLAAGSAASPPAAGGGAAAPLREIVARPGVRPALLAALASFAVMVAVMNLSGYVVVEHQHHPQSAVFPIIGAHVLGMYALVLVVGTIIDRIGRPLALAGGLVAMGASCAGLLWAQGVVVTAVLLFGLGVGWNFSFVAATAELADRTGAAERGRVLGFSDLLSALLGAALALIGGLALDGLGVAALALGATLLVIAPLVWLSPRRPRPVPAGG